MKYFEEIIEEVKETGSKVSDQEAQQLLEAIEEARHIFVAGAGRSGLMIRGFANRLLHLGFSVSIVGEISSPHTQASDLLLIGSGSGETASLINQAKTAKANKVTIALVTTNPQSTLAGMADVVLIIPAQSKTDRTHGLQPMGSLFEQTTLFIYDSLVLSLMEAKQESNDTMKLRHADLE